MTTVNEYARAASERDAAVVIAALMQRAGLKDVRLSEVELEAAPALTTTWYHSIDGAELSLHADIWMKAEPTPGKTWRELPKASRVLGYAMLVAVLVLVVCCSVYGARVAEWLVALEFAGLAGGS